MLRKVRPILAAMVVMFPGSGGRSEEASPPETVHVPAGAFIAGSDQTEREHAYRLDEQAYGHSVTRQQRWYENERPRQTVEVGAFEIMKTLVTNADYAHFVAATGHRPPNVDRSTWEGYGLNHPYSRTRRPSWSNRRPPPGRAGHPVVLVSRTDAEAFARWLSARLGVTWRLPTELEWEKAARGTDGRWFPWGQEWDPKRANTHDLGPFDTTPVDAYSNGVSPYKMMDPAGNVFEWTADSEGGRPVVKGGGSWDEKGCGVCRPAARHTRPRDLKHILIGFRLVRKLR